MAGISVAQKAHLQEVADLMLDIYQTLAQMRYIDARGIQTGPHDISKLRPLYEEHGLDPSIIYLYSILPYVDTAAAGNEDFFHGGTFTDFRIEDDVEQGRDPFYGSPSDEDFEDEDGPYMRPWVTPLSRLGNHNSVIVYDARKHQIWIIDQEGWSTTDPALEDVEEETPKSKNRNSFDHIPSRPAGDVLRDIVRWYRELEELPGGGEYSGLEWSPDLGLKELYRKHGWPDNFDGDAFQVDKARAYCADTVKYRAEEPLREMEKYRDWKEWNSRTIQDRQKSLSTAKNPDEEWMMRLDLWDAEQSYRRNTKELEKAEENANTLCPGGVCLKSEEMPLLEADVIRQEYESKQRQVEAERNWMEEATESDPERTEEFRISLYHVEKEEAIYRKAWEAARADAERLCPGRTLDSVTEMGRSERQQSMAEVQRIENFITSLQPELAALREWATQIPVDAPNARDKVNRKMEDYERSIESSQARLATLKATL